MALVVLQNHHDIDLSGDLYVHIAMIALQLPSFLANILFHADVVSPVVLVMNPPNCRPLHALRSPCTILVPCFVSCLSDFWSTGRSRRSSNGRRPPRLMLLTRTRLLIEHLIGKHRMSEAEPNKKHEFSQSSCSSHVDSFSPAYWSIPYFRKGLGTGDLLI